MTEIPYRLFRTVSVSNKTQLVFSPKLKYRVHSQARLKRNYVQTANWNIPGNTFPKPPSTLIKITTSVTNASNIQKCNLYKNEKI